MKFSNLLKAKIKGNLGFFVVLLLSFIPLIELLHPGLPLTHDGRDHVARIANFYLSLTEGNIIPRWATNLNWGYGHPVMMFLYPLPSYVASFFHLIGFSFIDSVKLVFALGFIGSGITMYLWIRNFLGEYAGVVAGVLYMYAPYRFIDLYVRGAIGEHTSFVFMPLVLYFLLKLGKSIEKNKINGLYLIGIAFSFAALLLSHNAISIMFLPIVLAYILYLAFTTRSWKILTLSFAGIILGGFISAFFLVPAFFEGKYTLRDIVTGKNEYADRFVNPTALLYGKWSYGGTGQFSVQIGIVQIICAMLSPYILFVLHKIRSKYFSLYLIFFISFIASLFLVVAQSDFIYQIITIFQKFQFPWRFLTITVLTTSVLGGFVVYFSKNKTILGLLTFTFIVLALFFNRNYWHAQGFLQKPESYFSSIYDGTTDTGESSPIWSIRFMEHRAKSRIEVIGGEAKIFEQKRNSTEHHYLINATTDKAQIRENTVYFPGWRIFVNGRETPIEFQDQHNLGVITFFVPKGKNDVVVKFTNTKLRSISDTVSFVAIILLMGGGVYLVIEKRKL